MVGSESTGLRGAGASRGVEGDAEARGCGRPRAGA